ncbi:hypothetical protein D3C71_1439340 [compost metagenome]
MLTPGVTFMTSSMPLRPKSFISCRVITLIDCGVWRGLSTRRVAVAIVPGV